MSFKSLKIGHILPSRKHEHFNNIEQEKKYTITSSVWFPCSPPVAFSPPSLPCNKQIFCRNEFNEKEYLNFRRLFEQ